MHIACTGMYGAVDPSGNAGGARTLGNQSYNGIAPDPQSRVMPNETYGALITPVNACQCVCGVARAPPACCMC